MRALLPVSARSGACLTGAGFASFERQERKSIVFTFCSCPGQGTVARNKIAFEKQFLSKVHSAGEHEYCCCRFPHVFCDRGQPFKLSPVVSLYSRRFAFLSQPLRSISIRRCGLRTPTATMRHWSLPKLKRSNADAALPYGSGVHGNSLRPRLSELFMMERLSDDVLKSVQLQETAWPAAKGKTCFSGS